MHWNTNLRNENAHFQFGTKTLLFFSFSSQRINYTSHIDTGESEPNDTGESEDSVSAQLQLKEKLKPEVKDDFVC